jgi:hypothetical protein
MPDNVDFQPSTGILYVLMDATTSAEDPAFTNDDVWACLPDGADSDTLSDGCAVPHTTDMLQISGLKSPDHD